MCGLTQWHYAIKNASYKTRTTVKYFCKMLASATESIVFVALGLVLIEDATWNTGFIVWTLVLITVVRFVVVFVLSALANHWLIRQIRREEQFLMAYGGMRGAIAFALAVQINPLVVGGKRRALDGPSDQRHGGVLIHATSGQSNYELFLTAVIVVIMYTVFVQVRFPSCTSLIFV